MTAEFLRGSFSFSWVDIHKISLPQHASADVRAKMRAAAERIGQMADRFPARC